MAFTFFFRDGQTLELVIDQMLPALAGQAFIRIWDAGCAYGPEPYTLAILLRERLSDYVFHNVTIHATDIDPTGEFAERIAKGVYSRQEVKRIPPRIFQKYFEETDQPDRFRVVEEIRARVQFSRHDLLSLRTIREGLSLIVCKNVLLHFSETQRREVVRMFYDSLRDDGFLAMEHTQKMPHTARGLFQPASASAQVYRKIPAESQAPVEKTLRTAHGRTRYRVRNKPVQSSGSGVT